MKMLALHFTGLLLVMTVSVALSDGAVVAAARKLTKNTAPNKGQDADALDGEIPQSSSTLTSVRDLAIPD